MPRTKIERDYLPADASASHICGLVAELFDYTVYHPAMAAWDALKDHPIADYKFQLAETSLDLNELAQLNRTSEMAIADIMRAIHDFTSPRERSLIFQSSSSSNDSVSDMILPSPTISVSAMRAVSFSAGLGDINVPDPISEPRCSQYAESEHECEEVGCAIEEEKEECSDSAVILTSPLVSEQPEDPLLAALLDVSLRSSSPLSRTTSESPLGNKQVGGMSRAFSVPENCILGSAPMRKRAFNTQDEDCLVMDATPRKHEPSKSLPAPSNREVPVLRLRENTL